MDCGNVRDVVDVGRTIGSMHYEYKYQLNASILADILQDFYQ